MARSSGDRLRVDGTPEHQLATDRADVNSMMGRFVLWFEGIEGVALVAQGDINRNTGQPWTHEELVDVANRINRRVTSGHNTPDGRTMKTDRAVTEQDRRTIDG